jgi:ring-1,2-phenylacetyl-CoA epoxidase subunit PaaD
VLAVLDEVMDPEVPVLSVRELGIIRDVDVAPDGAVLVTVTPTYSGCPAIQVIEDDILSALAAAGVRATVRTTYAPAWTSDWIEPAARAKLKAYGIAPPGPRDDSGGLVQLMRRRAAAQCPYCGSHETELRSEFGSTACKAVCWCRACRQPFEEFKAI